MGSGGKGVSAGWLVSAVLLGLYVGTAAGACTVGDTLQLTDGGRGTLVEVGSESPHVGWYRIAFTWAPKGEWFDPSTWETRKVDTGEVCSVGASVRPAPAGTARANASVESAASRPAAADRASVECPFVEPPGRVARGSRASAPLFQRVIYERAAAGINPGSMSAPTRVGLSFLDFVPGDPYENTLTSTRFGDKRLHTGAPAGAIVYPLQTVELECDLHGREVRRTVREVSRTCFVNADGDWTCPGRTTKTRESRLIPMG